MLDGFGIVNMPMTSSSPAARQWLEHGRAQAYAFNEVEAVRAFKAGLTQLKLNGQWFTGPTR